jgi:nucleotide-binding universal stress UspA family protein
MSWQPIVVGVDSSPEAARAAAFAVAVAERAGTTCQIVHAARDVLASAEVPENGGYRHALVAQARDEIRAALTDAVRPGVLKTISVRIGAAPVVLKEAVAALGAELIVLGGKHHSALDRWFGGSTSLNVGRTTEVPVLVTAGAPAIRRVLVAVDLSGAARATLAAAERYAMLFGAELRAVSVLEPLPVIPGAPPPDPTGYYALSEELLKGDVWPLIRARGAEQVVRYGPAVETIAREATDWQADLLVMGSHGKGWAKRMFLGSVTERLLNQLPTSLLVVPTGTAVVVEREPAPQAARPRPLVAIA